MQRLMTMVLAGGKGKHFYPPQAAPRKTGNSLWRQISDHRLSTHELLEFWPATHRGSI
jgi:hypothetical protein